MRRAIERRLARIRLLIGPMALAAVVVQHRPMPTSILDRSLLERAMRHSVSFLEELPGRHVGTRIDHEELSRHLSRPLPDGGEDAAAVLDSLAAIAPRATLGSAGPRFFGFVIGGSLPVALAADWMTSAWDQNSGLYATSPLAAVVEDIAQEWLLDLLRLPADASLGFVSGGQMAEFTCLAAARHAVLRDAGWNVEEEGLNGAPRVNVVLSAEAHVTIYVALRYLGLGTRATIVPTDDQGRMRVDELKRVLDGLQGPTIVCAQAGNVNNGAFDPLRGIAEVTRPKKAWLHVDGAFGLWAAATASRRSLVDGAELADSWACDAHKWLNVPYDCGMAIVRDSAAHRASMTSKAAYLQQSSGVERDALDWTPEFSRRARAVTVYAAIRSLGRRGVERLIEGCCERAKQFETILRRDSRVQILADVVLNQVLVRIGDSDEHTRAVITRVQNEGTCWLAGTSWKGKAAIRISVSNWATSEEDVARSAQAILAAIG